MKKCILSVDLITAATVILLMLSALFVLTSATDDIKRLNVQTLCVFIGTFFMIALCFWDYKSTVGKKNHIYILCIISLVIVLLFGIGKEEKGATSWIRFGHIGIQPSEFVKLLFGLYLSLELSQKCETNTLNDKKVLVFFLLRCAVIIALVILQNDTGTALVFMFMLLMTLFVAGISKKYILAASISMLVLIPVIWFLLADYQRDRIMVFINPDMDLSDAGYQVHLAKLALSSGGIFGKGYKNGAVNTLSYLPEKETDFIFSVIGEEFGLFGTIYFITLFALLIFKMFYIAAKSKDLQGKLLVTAICAMFLFHIIENIGMTIGLLPVTGIPLPFVSYGGSSMLSMSLGVGLVLAVRRKTYTLLNS